MLEILYLYCRERTYCDPGKGQYECTRIKKDRIGFTKARESGYIYMHGPIYEAVGVICRRSRSKPHCAFRQARIISKESPIGQ